jgi:hypothetical protein
MLTLLLYQRQLLYESTLYSKKTYRQEVLDSIFYFKKIFFAHILTVYIFHLFILYFLLTPNGFYYPQFSELESPTNDDSIQRWGGGQNN